ncbi:MAG: hypothetical protein K2X82_14170, partial [Gemmataceae bacterium]|nr:hypothetical protein [Gemmataceae bacterium]
GTPGPAAPAAPASAARPPVQEDRSAWAHFRKVAGDSKESRALFDLMTADPDRAKQLDRAAADPTVAAKQYADEVARLHKAWNDAFDQFVGRLPAPAPEPNDPIRAATNAAVPPADVLAVLFLGSLPHPDKAADPAEVDRTLEGSFVDLARGPEKAAVRKLFAAWLDRRRDPKAAKVGLDGALYGAIPEAVPAARKWLADPKAPPGAVGTAALVLGNHGTADDLPRLAKLRDDGRVYLEAKTVAGVTHTAQVRDVAAAMSLVLRGEDFGKYGFPEVKHHAAKTGPDPAPFRAITCFEADADRAAAHEKAWGWLDKQPMPVSAAAAPVPEDRPAWAHFKSVCGDTKESRALFAAMTKDPERAKLFDQAAADPAEAAQQYAAELARVREASEKAAAPLAERAFSKFDVEWRAANVRIRAATTAAVPPADVLRVLFLGSLPHPDKAADPADVSSALDGSFIDLVTGPNKAAARKLFAAWLGGRRDPEAVRAGLHAGMLGAVPEGVPVARRWLADPKASLRAVEPAALVLGNLGAPADDLPRLAKFRDDARACAVVPRAGGPVHEVQVRDVAAAMSLHLRGQDFAEYGFTGVRWTLPTTAPDPAPCRGVAEFESDEARAAALKKAWAWLDKQPKPEPAKK